MEIKRRREKNQSQCSSCKSSYIYKRNCLKYCLTGFLNCLETNMRYETSQTPNRWSPAKTGAIPIHTQPFHFPLSKQYLCQRHDSQRMHERRSSGKEVWLERKNHHELTPALFSYFINLTITLS